MDKPGANVFEERSPESHIFYTISLYTFSVNQSKTKALFDEVEKQFDIVRDEMDQEARVLAEGIQANQITKKHLDVYEQSDLTVPSNGNFDPIEESIRMLRKKKPEVTSDDLNHLAEKILLRTVFEGVTDPQGISVTLANANDSLRLRDIPTQGTNLDKGVVQLWAMVSEWSRVNDLLRGEAWLREQSSARGMKKKGYEWARNILALAREVYLPSSFNEEEMPIDSKLEEKQQTAVTQLIQRREDARIKAPQLKQELEALEVTRHQLLGEQSKIKDEVQKLENKSANRAQGLDAKIYRFLNRQPPVELVQLQDQLKVKQTELNNTKQRLDQNLEETEKIQFELKELKNQLLEVRNILPPAGRAEVRTTDLKILVDEARKYFREDISLPIGENGFVDSSQLTDQQITALQQWREKTRDGFIEMPDLDTLVKKVFLAISLWPQKSADGQIHYLFGKGIGAEIAILGKVKGRTKYAEFETRAHSDFELYGVRTESGGSPYPKAFQKVFGGQEYRGPEETKGLKLGTPDVEKDKRDSILNHVEEVDFGGLKLLIPDLELSFLDKYIAREGNDENGKPLHPGGIDAERLAKAYDLDPAKVGAYLQNFYIQPNSEKIKKDFAVKDSQAAFEKFWGRIRKQNDAEMGKAIINPKVLENVANQIMLEFGLKSYDETIDRLLRDEIILTVVRPLFQNQTESAFENFSKILERGKEKKIRETLVLLPARVKGLLERIQKSRQMNLEHAPSEYSARPEAQETPAAKSELRSKEEYQQNLALAQEQLLGLKNDLYGIEAEWNGGPLDKVKVSLDVYEEPFMGQKFLRILIRAKDEWKYKDGSLRDGLAGIESDNNSVGRVKGSLAKGVLGQIILMPGVVNVEGELVPTLMIHEIQGATGVQAMARQLNFRRPVLSKIQNAVDAHEFLLLARTPESVSSVFGESSDIMKINYVTPFLRMKGRGKGHPSLWIQTLVDVVGHAYYPWWVYQGKGLEKIRAAMSVSEIGRIIPNGNQSRAEVRATQKVPVLAGGFEGGQPFFKLLEVIFSGHRGKGLIDKGGLDFKLPDIFFNGVHFLLNAFHPVAKIFLPFAKDTKLALDILQNNLKFAFARVRRVFRGIFRHGVKIAGVQAPVNLFFNNIYMKNIPSPPALPASSRSEVRQVVASEGVDLLGSPFSRRLRSVDGVVVDLERNGLNLTRAVTGGWMPDAERGRQEFTGAFGQTLHRAVLNELQNLPTPEAIVEHVWSLGVPEVEERLGAYRRWVDASELVSRIQIAVARNLLGTGVVEEPVRALEIAGEMIESAKFLLNPKNREILEKAYQEKYQQTLGLKPKRWLVLDWTFLRDAPPEGERTRQLVQEALDNGGMVLPFRIGQEHLIHALIRTPGIRAIGYNNSRPLPLEIRGAENPLFILSAGTPVDRDLKPGEKKDGVVISDALYHQSQLDAQALVPLVELTLQVEFLRKQLEKETGLAFPRFTENVLMSVLGFLHDLARTEVARQAMARAA